MTDDARSAAIWSFPDSEISTAALTLMLEISPTFIANHNQRSYVFARELAAAKGLCAGADYDDELVFLACILHDLGITRYGQGIQRFEVDGADAAARFLREHSLPEADITTVWQSIALHTSLGLAHRFGTDQAITHWGISVDVDGREKDLLSAGFADRVHTAWPRHDLPYAMADLIAADIATTPSKAPPFTFPGHLAELLNGPVPSFFDVAAHNGWNDQPATRAATHWPPARRASSPISPARHRAGPKVHHPMCPHRPLPDPAGRLGDRYGHRRIFLAPLMAAVPDHRRTVAVSTWSAVGAMAAPWAHFSADCSSKSTGAGSFWSTCHWD